MLKFFKNEASDFKDLQISILFELEESKMLF